MNINVSKIPQRLTDRYLSTLNKEEKEFVIAYKQEQSRLNQIEHVRQYRNRNKKEISEKRRARRLKLKEQEVKKSKEPVEEQTNAKNDFPDDT